MSKRLASLLSLCVLAAATPAVASTMPSTDFQAGHFVGTLGIADLGLDYAISDHQSLGVVGTVFGSAGARSTWRLGGEAGAPNWGYTVGAGYAFLDPGSSYLGSPPYNPQPYESTNWTHGNGGYWFSPALMGTLPLRLPFGGIDFVLRGALGPGLFVAPDTNGGGLIYDVHWALMPNFDLAIRFPTGTELTFLGQSTVGLRQAF